MMKTATKKTMDTSKRMKIYTKELSQKSPDKNKPSLCFLLMVITNSLFDILVIVLNAGDLSKDSLKLFIFCLSFSLGLILLISLQFAFFRKLKSSETLKSFLGAFQCFCNCVLLYEREMAFESGLELEEFGKIWCITFLTLSFRFLVSRDFCNNLYPKSMTALFTIYLIIRVSLAKDFKYLILLSPLAIIILEEYLCSRVESAGLDGSIFQIGRFSSVPRDRNEDSKVIGLSDKSLQIPLPNNLSEKSLGPKLDFETIMPLLGIGIVIYNINDDLTPLYFNNKLENAGDNKNLDITSLIRTKFFTTPVIKQDENIKPIYPENCSSKSGNSHRLSNKNSIIEHENDYSIRKGHKDNFPFSHKEDDDYAVLSSALKYSNYAASSIEPLGNIIQKLKIACLYKKEALKLAALEFQKENSQNSKTEKSEAQSLKTTPRRNYTVIDCYNLLVEYRSGDVAGEIIRQKDISYQVEIVFFEDKTIDNGSSLFYLLKFKCLEGENSLINFQKDVDSFKAQFISSLSHELKTPLNCTINMLELLKMECSAESEKNSSRLEKINAALQNSKILVCNINDILDYSELLSNKFVLHPSKFSLKSLLNNTIELISLSAKERSNSIKLEYDKNLSDSIISDEGRLNQIVLNLLTNANKFTTKGSIKVSAKLYGCRDIKISVSDTGTGIKPRLIKKIGILGMAKENKLVGLGLTISNYLASVIGPLEKKGLSVSSKPGKGSVFTLFVENFRESQLKLSSYSSINGKTETFEQLNLNNLKMLYTRSKIWNSTEVIPMLKEKPKYEEDGFDEDGLEIKSEDVANSSDISDIETISECVYEQQVFDENLQTENIEVPNSVQNLMNALGQPLGTKLRLEKETLLKSGFLMDGGKDFENSSNFLREKSKSIRSNRSSNREKEIREEIDYQRLFPVPKSLNILFRGLSNATEEKTSTAKKTLGNDLCAKSMTNSVKPGKLMTTEENLYTSKHEVAVDANSLHPINPNESLLENIKETDTNKLNIIKNIPSEQRSREAKIKERGEGVNVVIKVSEESADSKSSFSRNQPDFLKQVIPTLPQVLANFKKQKSCDCSELLIVDDNGYNLMVLRLMVESLGIKTDTANSGEEAISIVKKKLAGTPNCKCLLHFIILMDLDMPEKDGIATTREILHIFDALKITLRPIIIACTAFHESEFGERCFKAGMKDFITKPIKRDILEKTLANHLYKFL